MDMKWRDQNWLRKHYITQGKSMPAMAKEAKCSHVTIGNWLHRYKIPVRGCGEGIFLAKRNFVNIAPDFLEFLRGEIVGDGCVRMRPSNRSARYSHSSKYRAYVVWLSESYDAWGIEQTGQITWSQDKRSEFHNAIVYHYTSRSYPELVPIYKRWYPDGKKTVPKDLKLTPIMARQWYLGDGGLDGYKCKRPGIVLSTNDFDYPSIDHLIKELQKQGFKTTYWPSSNRIYISVHSVKDFLEWIGPCPVACYNYKWDYSG